MSTTSKSPRWVLRVAYHAAREALPSYGHRFSPKKFTQPQLLACLALKEFQRLDYRGLAAFLADLPELARLIGLEAVPHFTTFQKAAARLLAAAPARDALAAVLDVAIRAKVLKRRVRLAALDATGLESRHVSRYFLRRRGTGEPPRRQAAYTRYPMVSLLCDCASHLPLAARAGRGPRSDLGNFKPVLRDAGRRVRIGTLLADADYDAEWAHEFARGVCGVRTLIRPGRGRPTDRPPTGRWRRRMWAWWDERRYGQRWQVEACNSMLKRRLGSALRARSYWSQCREIALRVLTLAVMIVA